MTIDILPDNVFLDIFDFCLFQPDWESWDSTGRIQRMKEWQTLVHVCQRWRSLIYASPRRLDLYLRCSYETRVRKNLVYWPVTLPLIVDYGHPNHTPEDDDVLAALEHSGRVHRISIVGTDSLLRKVVKVMHKQFPALSHLSIDWNLNGSVPVIPKRFLGRSASQLQDLTLTLISLPHLPVLLSSARNLVTIMFEDIFQDGHAYISPKVLAEGLAMLPNLTFLYLTFHDDTSTTDRSSPIRAILPSLTLFDYRGCSNYLEDFLARLDAPRVDCVEIELFPEHDYRAPQLFWFLNRTENLKSDQFRRARLFFLPKNSDFSFKLDDPTGNCCQGQLSLEMWRGVPVLDLVHILCQLTATFSKVDHLSVHGDHDGLGEMDSTEWLPFLRQFPAVETLHLSGGVAAYIVSAIERTADSVTDLLPALHQIWLEDRQNDDDDVPVPVGSIERFLSLRQLSGRPVTIVNTHDEFVEATDRNPL